MVRVFILTHRYVGIATCLLFAMWFGSGMVMMYVGFPELTAEERLHGLTPLDLSAAHVLPAQARWRPRTRYRSGRRSPYHGALHWHHVLGLLAAVPLYTWIVSGWMSLEPGQWVSDRAIDRVMSERYTGLDRPRASFTAPPATAWQVAPLVPPAKEVRLQFWDGKPLYVFASSSDHRQLISGDDRPVSVAIGAPEVVARAAHRLLPDVPVTQVAMLHAYDFYWYAHHTPRPLPVLRLRFDDPPARC